jgi:hypothetical protein
MLDEAFFSTVGKFAVSFSNLDYTVANYTRLFLECRDRSIAAHVVDPLTFGQKLELLLWLVDHYAERRGLKNSEMVRELRTKLGEVKQLATRRNDVFHGEVWIHAAEITVTLVNRHKGRSTEVKAIQRLTSDADLLFKSISLLLSQFDNRVATDGRPTKIPLGEPT